MLRNNKIVLRKEKRKRKGGKRKGGKRREKEEREVPRYRPWNSLCQRLNRAFNLKFPEGYLDQQTPDDGWRVNGQNFVTITNIKGKT